MLRFILRDSVCIRSYFMCGMLEIACVKASTWESNSVQDVSDDLLFHDMAATVLSQRLPIMQFDS